MGGVGVSVSFGKYENEDSLCFSPNNNNKYLEEVGKCSTPGSVAQKKAFFEAHYKKIAAMKAAAAAAAEEIHHESGTRLEEPYNTTQSPININVEAVDDDDQTSFQSPIITTLNTNLHQPILLDKTPHFQHPPNVTPKLNRNKVENIEMTIKSFGSKSPELETPAKESSSSCKGTTKNKKQSVSESRRVTPVEFHLSVSMTSINYASSRRRSLFMEQMGDKDIVKRAFKTFQNRVNQLPSNPGQLPIKTPHQKTSTSVSYQKENERSRKAVEKMNPARRPTWKSVSSGSHKEVGVDEIRLKAGPTSIALKSNEKAEKRKELFKKLEEKSNAREKERSQRSSKLKVEVKDTETKKVKHNLNFKAKRVPQPQGTLRNTSDKETIKDKVKIS
ncbi:hypothetical protein R6Q59_011905 [Mikania micrantha]